LLVWQNTLDNPSNAIAVIYRTGSGGRLTSRCCHEITWPFLLVSCGTLECLNQ
jgi:hypothetical protein